MGNFLVKILLSCIGIGYAISVNAQDNITGRILDEQEQGLDAVVVMLASLPENVLIETAVTDSNGHFYFPVHKGEFLLCVRTLGYKEIKKNITIAGPQTLPDIQMEPDNISLQDVVVTARKSRPMATSSNGKIQIHIAQSYLTDIGNALDVLKHTPGVSVNNKGGISLASLGGTAIYVNGRKLMLQGDELSTYLRSLSSEKISQIEISHNPNASFGSDGAGGIINIMLKASEKSGFFVTTSHSMGYWENLKQNSDIALSYNTNKWQLGMNYNHSLGHYSMDYGYEKIQNGDKNISETTDTDKRNTYSAGIDFSWQPNQKNKLFMSSTVNLLAGPGETQTTTYIYQGTNLLDNILKARNNYIEQKNLQYNNSVNYLYKPTSKAQFSFSADWTHFDGKARCEQPNEYFSPANTLIRSDFFYSEPDKDIDIYALLADYKYNPDGQNELLAGIKTTLIKSNNTFLFKKNGDVDPQRSNSFFYKEKNLEAYAQYTHTWNKTELSAGVRMEYMHTYNRLHSQTNQDAETNSQDHLRLFPNLSATYTINEKNKIALIYSRRQDKPRYEDLNPFEYLLDELTYWKGNPFLKPQISNKVMLSYTWSNLSLNLYYNKLDDYFTSLTDVYGDNKTIMTTKNIGTQQQVGLDAIFSKRLTSWWNFSTNAGLYYFMNKLDYETYKHEYKRPSCFLSATNSILLPLGINFEISGRYYSKRQGGSYEVSKATGGMDLGINKNWHEGSMRLSLLMTDVFHTERWDSYGIKDALDLSSWGYGESRKVLLRFSYSFGKQKFEKADKNIEELNRL